MRVKYGNATKDVPILEVTPENYIVPKGEEGTYHCRIEQRQFNPRTGQRLSKPFIQKFEPKTWAATARNLRQQGWEIDILYDPTNYLKEQEEKANLTAQQIAAAKAKAEAERKAAERQALKEELLAELKAAGVIPAKKEAKGGKKNGKGSDEGKADTSEK